MVAKPMNLLQITKASLNLAKIHMVAKLILDCIPFSMSLNLAKIHMVAKQQILLLFRKVSLNLAKIHMVAKHIHRLNHK